MHLTDPRQELLPDTEWPPRSPGAALAASPSGRKRLEKYYQHRLSPSPTRRRVKSPDAEEVSAAGEGEEDEETLKLQIKALEAKLKLKNLQKKKQEDQSVRQAPVPGVAVPSSPKRDTSKPPISQSPRRAQLGIDKGLKAADISLKSARSATDARHKERSEAPNGSDQWASKSKSYAERLLASRGQDTVRGNKQQRSRASQTRSFGIRQVPDYSQRENHEPEQSLGRTTERSHLVASSATQNASKDYDQYSQQNLSKRMLDNPVLDKALADKELITIPRLLKDVNAPDYDPPDAPGDYVVFGIIASKSKPYDHAPTHKTTSESDAQPHRSKFMVLRLTDLEWEVDLFLFGEGFETFWKLTLGTVIAVLNPGIMPPKAHMRDSGKFSLKLGSSEDTVLEIGTAADLGFCKSVKSDGQTCGTWVDGRKTEYCEFHVGLQVAKTKSSRMEINTMGSLNLFQKASDSRKGRGRGRGSGGYNPFGGRQNQQERKPKTTTQGQYYDREAHSAAFGIPSSMQRGTNAAKLLDAEDHGPGAGLSAAERRRKRLAAHEKERDLARALGKEGTGPGVEYLRTKHQEGRESSQRSANNQRPDAEDSSKDAASFGLVRSRSDALGFDPMKGRKSRREAVGWSKAFKRGLSPTATVRSPSPKKARFMIDGKGTRTPGAESIPSAKKRRHGVNDDDDLELV